MEDKKKNDIATKPLNAGQRVAARGVLCGAIEALGSIRMLTADRKVLTGWLAGQTDILSEDWEIVGGRAAMIDAALIDSLAALFLLAVGVTIFVAYVAIALSATKDEVERIMRDDQEDENPETETDSTARP